MHSNSKLSMGGETLESFIPLHSRIDIVSLKEPILMGGSSTGLAKIPEASIPVSIVLGIFQVSIRIDTLSILTPKNYLFILLFYLYKNIFIYNSFYF